MNEFNINDLRNLESVLGAYIIILNDEQENMSASLVPFIGDMVASELENFTALLKKVENMINLMTVGHFTDHEYQLFRVAIGVHLANLGHARSLFTTEQLEMAGNTLEQDISTYFDLDIKISRLLGNNYD